MSEDTSPWQTLSSQRQYENPWIEVTEHQVVNPGGGPGIYGTVHFKHLAIGIIPLDADGSTWLVGQHRYPLDRYSWEIPEGGGDLHIDPLESAKRELKEETGIEAATWQLLLEMDLSNSVTDEHALIYLATGLTYGESAPEESEVLELRHLSLDAAVAMVLDGEITDSISVAGLLRLHLLQQESR